jgi:hypothetical protein
MEGVHKLSDPLESSRRKLARAKEHFADLQRKISEFEDSDPYIRVEEIHPDKINHLVHKVKLTHPLPTSFENITVDLVGNLRSSLDKAGYAVAVASGVKNPRFSAFPFAGSVADLENSLAGRCKDIPKQIQLLFRGFQPYPGGDDLLCALNEICNADKHKIIKPIGTGVIRTHVNVRGIGFAGIPRHPVWDSAKNEMELITLGPGAKFECEFEFRVFVAFSEIKAVEGHPVLGVLDALIRKVEGILLAIEAEAKHIGIFT